MKKLTSLLIFATLLSMLTACTEAVEEPTEDSSEISSTGTTGLSSVLHVGETSKEEYENLASYEVHPFDARALLENEENNIKLLDVREPDEYDQSHIKDAILIPLGNISGGYLRANGINPTDFVIIYCRSGNRSAQAYEILQSLGYYNANSMAGGITFWSSKGYPVEQ